MGLTVGVVVPAFNEEATIAGVIDGLRQYATKIIVSSDGSTDRTVDIARSAGAVVVDGRFNRGPERATELGCIRALQDQLDVLVTFDADGQHLPEYVPQTVKLLEEGKADIVVGMRSEFPRFSEHLFSFYSTIRLGVHDPICGLKAFRAEVYRDIGYFDTVRGITAQILFQAHKRGYKLAQIPIEVLERDDVSRFGRAFTANRKILLGLARVILNDIGILK